MSGVDPVVRALETLAERTAETSSDTRVRVGVVHAVDGPLATIRVGDGDAAAFYPSVPAIGAVQVGDVVYWLHSKAGSVVLGHNRTDQPPALPISFVASPVLDAEVTSPVYPCYTHMQVTEVIVRIVGTLAGNVEFDIAVDDGPILATIAIDEFVLYDGELRIPFDGGMADRNEQSTATNLWQYGYSVATKPPGPLDLNNNENIVLTLTGFDGLDSVTITLVTVNRGADVPRSAVATPL